MEKRAERAKTKCNKKSRHNNNTSINHDHALSDKSDVGIEEGDADGENSYEDMDFFKERWYKKTKPKFGRCIHPIPFTGPAKFFHPNISDKGELKGMMDAHGGIRFSKVVEWMLPKFDGETAYEFLSARMRNFMVHAMKTKGWKPKHYCPTKGKVIVTDDVTCFFGCQLAWSLRGNPSIERNFSTREIGTCMECMPKNAFEDIYTCLHFDNDWDEDDEWDDVYVDAKKAAQMELRITAGSFICLRTASTIGGRRQDPKPVCTSTTIHSLAIMYGNLVSYKVHVHVFGGATDVDLGKANDNTMTTQRG
ncbi:hypothetical protein ACHAW5_004860 [Stephanodiscus triporus]|uniref:PiggyBac transposable element-derived protein domain-containing protein n=1 Tax=Stephanodiscus triporus TaxID=2934178 RepID=A0ABD3ND91_9STRA